jgi:para-nitrobenzyl esterase
MRRRMAPVVLVALLLAGCAGPLPPPRPPGPSLAGTAWQLVRFKSSDDTIVTPDDRSQYKLAFARNGSFTARIDCNRARGTWTSTAPGQVELGPLALTRAMCPPGSLHDRMVRHLSMVRSYMIMEGRLFLSLMADGGIYEFAPSAP